MQVLVNLNLNRNELQNAIMQPLATPPSSPIEGQFYYDSVAKKMKQYDGATWVIYGESVNWNNILGKPDGIVVDTAYVHTDNNFTTPEKTKLNGIQAGAEINVNADWNANSGDAQILNKPVIPTKTSQLANDSDFATSASVASAVGVETTNRTSADNTLQANIDATNAKIDNIKAVQILNKGIINSTIANVQTTATNYIVSQYGRQPQNLDGLIITLTDSVPPNDKVQYVFSGVSNVWVDTGSAQTQISEGSKTDKGVLQVGDGINVASGVISTNKATIGLGNVENTTDLSKPISTATQNALNLKANISQLPPTISKQTTTISTVQTSATVTVVGYILSVDVFDSVTKSAVMCDILYSGGTTTERTTVVVSTVSPPANVLNVVVTYVAS